MIQKLVQLPLQIRRAGQRNTIAVALVLRRRRMWRWAVLIEGWKRRQSERGAARHVPTALTADDVWDLISLVWWIPGWDAQHAACGTARRQKRQRWSCWEPSSETPSTGEVEEASTSSGK